MILYAFTVFVILGCVISIKKKRFFEFFFPMFLFLPDYYGLEISGALPILTVKRILILVLLVYVFVLYRNRFFALIKGYGIKSIHTLLILYFVARIGSNIRYITTYGQPLKTILSIIVEEAVLLVAFQMASPDEEECNSIIKSVVYSSAVMFALGIVESITDLRLTDALYTVSRYMLDAHYYRLGFLRSTVTMGLPSIYGNYCVMAFPLILYAYEHTKQKRFLFILLLAIMACIHSGSRAAMLFGGGMAVLGGFVYCKEPKRLMLYLKNALIVVGSVFGLVCVLSVLSPQFETYYMGTARALLNEVGLDFEMEGEEEFKETFGPNANGTLSRKAQLYGIPYVAGINFLFGLGSGAQNRGEICYYFHGEWKACYTYDIGFVQTFADEGLLGWIGYGSLFVALFVICARRYSNSKAYRYFALGLIAYLFCMLASANMQSILLMYTSFIITMNKLEFGNEQQGI